MEDKLNNMNLIAKNILFGVAVGDALGVPVEFEDREELQLNPVTDMLEYGTYNQPKGTWSDDSSLTFCLAESLIDGYNLVDIARKFVDWKNEKIWTPHGKVFDIGNITLRSINKLERILSDENYAELNKLWTKDENAASSNGNGSLMRILPLLMYIKDKNIEEQFEIVRDVSALTHPHIRSAVACLIYLKMAECLCHAKTKEEAYIATKNTIQIYFDNSELSAEEKEHFERIISEDISLLSESEIKSTGYVIDSLEASLWCLLTTKSYSECVLKAVNLGEDTDTTAAIAGGLAALYYGFDAIPNDWKNCLAKHAEIMKLAEKYEAWRCDA